MVNIIKQIKSKSKGLNSRIIFPEGEEDRILKAVAYSLKKKIIKPILVGNENIIKKKVKKLKINLDNVEIINPEKSENLEEYAKIYSKKKKISQNTAKLIVKKPLFFSTVALSQGHADGMIAGAAYPSGDVIAVSEDIVGLQKGISVPSSYFIMMVPNYIGGENGTLIYADASVNANPSSEELADIAITTGETAKNLLGWKPRVAILSFSTKGSAEHPDVCKVIKSVEIARKKSPGLSIDGELQADSALVMDVAKKKLSGRLGNVAGKANILIFPDLDAGNIAYKLTQRLAKANAYGPILQGFSKPISDLSRGATIEDIVGVISIISYWSKKWKK